MEKKLQGNSISGGFIWKFGERLISQGVSFLVSLALARILSPDDYGIISLVLVFINLANVFITSGFATALIQKKDADDTDFSTMFYCSMVCSLVIYFIVFFSAPFVAKFYNNAILSAVLRVYALQVPLSVYNSIQTAFVSRNMLFQKSFLSSFISAVLSGAIGIGMAYANFGVWSLVAQSISLTLFNTVVLCFILPWHPQLKFSLSAAKGMMKFGSRVLFADLSGTFFNEIRSLIIGRVYKESDLAFYTKGQQLPNLITGNLSTSVMAVLFPAMSNFSDSVEEVKKLARRSIKLLSYLMFPTLFGLIAVMKPLIIFLYTEKWSASIPYAQLLCFGMAFGVIGIVPLQTLKAIGRSDVVFGLEFLKKPVYVLLLIIGVKHSVFGIAVTMVIYELYGLFVNMLQMKKYINYNLAEQFKDLAPSILLSALMLLILNFIPAFDSVILTLFIKVIIGVLIYLCGSVLFKFEAFYYLKNKIGEIFLNIRRRIWG